MNVKIRFLAVGLLLALAFTSCSSDGDKASDDDKVLRACYAQSFGLCGQSADEMPETFAQVCTDPEAANGTLVESCPKSDVVIKCPIELEGTDFDVSLYSTSPMQPGIALLPEEQKCAALEAAVMTLMYQ